MTKLYHANVNVNLMVENVIQIKIGITINLDGNVKMQKRMVYKKKNLFGILLHVFVKIANI